MSNQRYMQRGVSASKEDVHNAIKNIDKGIFPKAFCKIIPDILGGDPEYCNIMHADGAGTKSSLALRVYKSASCKGGFADDDATLASIRAEGYKGGDLVVKGNMQVGNFEKKVAELYGIGVQVANADDTVLADNSVTLVAAGK